MLLIQGGGERESRTMYFQPDAYVNNWLGKWMILNRANSVLSRNKGQYCWLFITVIDSLPPLLNIALNHLQAGLYVRIVSGV